MKAFTTFTIACTALFMLMSGCGQKPMAQPVAHQQQTKENVDELEAHKQRARKNIEEFRRIFAEKDATVQVGTTLSNAVAVFGSPLTFTNNDGTVEAHFGCMPSGLGHVKIDTLTNGFSLLVSNGIIVRKAYSYTSSAGNSK